MACCEKVTSMNTDNKLRLTLVLFYILTLTFTLMTCLSLGWSVRIFGNLCPLYANLKLSMGSQNDSIILGDDNIWGPMVKCSFCVYSAVCGAILAIMWFWFYLLLSNFRVEDKDGLSMPPDTRLLLPSMFVNVPMAFVALVVASMITDGRAALCSHVRESLKEDCHVAGEKEWLHLVDGRHAFNYVRAAQYSSWLWLICLIVTIVVGAYRVHHFIDQGGRYASFSFSSYDTSTSTLSDDFYTDEEDEEYEEDNLQKSFSNPNYDTLEVPKTLSGRQLERVTEEVQSEKVGLSVKAPIGGGSSLRTPPSVKVDNFMNNNGGLQQGPAPPHRLPPIGKPSESTDTADIVVEINESSPRVKKDSSEKHKSSKKQ